MTPASGSCPSRRRVVSARVGTAGDLTAPSRILCSIGCVVAAPPPVPLAVAFRDPAHGVLGTSRTIELTADAGKTWKVVLQTPRPVVAVSYLDGAAWARFDDGENLRSTDDGRR